MNVLRFISIALILFILTVIAINIPDEKLTPEAERLLDQQAVSLPGGWVGEDNAFFAVLGYEAAEGRNIAEAGRAAHRAYYEEAEKGGKLPARTMLAEYIGPPLPFTEPFAIAQCDPLKPGCLAFYAKNLGDPGELLRENRLLLERYAVLQEYDTYSDMSFNPWNSWARLSSGIYAAHALTAAEAAHLANSQRYREALDLLVKDVLLWRKFLAGSADMDSKTFSLIALNRDYALLAELVDLFPSGAARLKDYRGIFALPTLQERSLDQVFNGYFRALYWSLAHYRNPVNQSRMGTLAGHFFKANATMNDAYIIFEGLKRTSRAEPANLEERLAGLVKDIKDVQRKDLDMIYNPLGKLFLANAFDGTVAVSWNSRVQVLAEKIAGLRTMIARKAEVHG